MLRCPPDTRKTAGSVRPRPDLPVRDGAGPTAHTLRAYVPAGHPPSPCNSGRRTPGGPRPQRRSH